jgi:hypothetical protein
MKISDLTAADLKILIRETIQEVLEEYRMDPDAGLSLRPEVRAQLEAAQTQHALGRRGIPAAKVAEMLGLDWSSPAEPELPGTKSAENVMAGSRRSREEFHQGK